MNDSSRMLGKLPPKNDPRTLQLAKYLSALPAPPSAVDWTAKAGAYGMMGNDRLGDCTCAAAGHMVQNWTGAATGAPVVISDADVLATYEGACGYDPTDPATDRGGIEMSVLNYWRQNGLGQSGHKIAAYVAVNPKNQTEVAQAIALFGGIYLGIALPTSAQSQVVWDVTHASPGDAGSWGGHAVPGAAYDLPTGAGWFKSLFGTPDGVDVITWGAKKRMTWAFMAAYCDEAYAIVTQDWLDAHAKSPSGLDLATLMADLAVVTA